MSELVGVSTVECKQTHMHAELRRVPAWGTGCGPHVVVMTLLCCEEENYKMQTFSTTTCHGHRLGMGFELLAKGSCWDVLYCTLISPNTRNSCYRCIN